MDARTNINMHTLLFLGRLLGEEGGDGLHAGRLCRLLQLLQPQRHLLLLTVHQTRNEHRFVENIIGAENDMYAPWTALAQASRRPPHFAAGPC